MADLVRLEKLLKSALDAGEMEDARYFQKEMMTHPEFESRRRSQLADIQKQVEPGIDPAIGTARSALQGLTFGFSDELAAGAMAPFVAASEGRALPKAYRALQQQFDQEQRQFTEEHPGLALPAEIAGGALTGGAGLARSGATTAGRSILSRLGRGAGTGAAEGGIYGAGTAEAGETLQGAGEGALIGGIAAPVAAVATKVASSGISPVTDWARRTIFSSPKETAGRFLYEGLSREGIDQTQLARALREMGPNAILADASVAARDALEGVVSKGDSPAIRKEAEALFEARNRGQQPRLIGELTENLGADTSLHQTVNRLQQERSAIAGPLYQEAYQQPLRPTEKLNSIMKAPAVGTALKNAQTIAANQRIAGDQISHIKLFDLAKQDLDDQIGSALRSGEKGRARDLMRLKSDLVEELDAQVPAYKQARDAFASHSSMIDAAEMGRRILREDADYMDDILKGMGEAEKEMFRVGAGRAIRDKLMQAAETGDATKRIGSSLLRERMQRAFPNREAFDQFMNLVEIEQDIFSTTNILNNSKTATRQQLIKRMEGVDIPGIEGGATGIVVGMFKKLLGAGLNDEARDELARMTMARLKDIDLDALNREINKSGLKEAQKEWIKKRLPEFAAATAAPAAVATNEFLNPPQSRQSALAQALRAQQ